MMRAFSSGAVAMILAFGTLQGHSDQTNLVQTLDLEFMGMEQGAAVTNGSFAVALPAVQTVGTARVIAALGAATGHSFSKAAKITVTTPLPEGALSFAVSDGSTSVDVSGFFTYEQLGDSVESWLLNLKTGKTVTSVTYSIGRFTLQDCPWYPALTVHFEVSGVASESLIATTALNPVGLSATATGPGDLNGNPLILQGMFAFRGNTLVVVPGGGAAND